ncbi:MAG: iron-containing alcohol dehydrogenase [Clostridia bacterium]|nr:iron-containing alcohol dehydrogenase [Clostridia bacterium]
MVSFAHYNPVRVFFGPGERKRIGEAVRTISGGKKVLLVTYEQHPFLDSLISDIISQLRAVGLEYVPCYNVTANPRISDIKKGIALVHEHDIGAIVGIGGGSAMDSAKSIGVGACYDGDVWDLFFSRGGRMPVPLPEKTIPTLMVPTLPATSSEMNNIAVATNDATSEKSHIWGDILYPAISVVDPELTCSLPAYQTACGAVDAISHILEAYFNCEPDTPVQDRLQEGNVVTIMELLPKILKNPTNVDLRASMQWASSLCWNGWLQCGVAPRSPMHPIGHTLSAHFGVTHGATLAIVMPSFFRYVVDRRIDRFAQFGRRIFNLTGTDREVAYASIDLFEKFIRDNGVPTKLHEVGVFEKDIPMLAEDVERVNCGLDGCLPSDPPVNRKDIEAILRMAL